MSAVLIVDLGSTCVAWRQGDRNGRLVHGDYPGAMLAGQIATPPRRVIVGSVAAAVAKEEFLAVARREWDLAPEFLVATAAAHGVRNGYRQAERLGIDRWAALVAAFTRHGGPVLVADCGTALTVDCVDADGQHAGGLIAPGLGLMQRALLGGTRLGESNASVPGGLDEGFGRDTGEAISRGCLVMLAGALERARARSREACGGEGRLLLTGGDAEAVLPHLSAGWEAAPGLVLEGLALLGGVAA